jgi:TRAP-type C4-dicarboxylate transport system permease small subunit
MSARESSTGGAEASPALSLPASPPAPRWAQWVANVPVAVACALAALMMVTTFVDVMLRYFFGRPIGGAFEVTELSMGLLVFFALPSVMLRRENIVVSLVIERLSARAQAWFAAIGDLLCAAVFLFIAWRMWLHGARLLRFKEVTMELAVPKGAVAQTMASLLVLAAICALIAAWQVLRASGTRSAGGSR